MKNKLVTEKWSSRAGFIIATAGAAIGLGNIINILNPQIVIVGTILVKASDLLLEPIREYIRAETWDRVYDMVRIVPAELGDSVGDLAAIAVMKQAFEETGAESL